MKIEAASRLKAAKADRDLNALCVALCDYEDDEICDTAEGDEIEYYGNKKDLTTALYDLGYKGKGNNFSKGTLSIKLIVPEGPIAKNTTYIRKAT